MCLTDLLILRFGIPFDAKIELVTSVERGRMDTTVEGMVDDLPELA